ncbi:Fic family protein [Paraburkholderia sp.]|uniref:Fic family protein n=1 Tax=Paraburkholderia sp. TaxID=1926495 RepID=UPI002D41906E|nr:Fic family protein [Paraburkholderia sp.]HZZ02925.1 Fic family protein [Paraburkholderia sp.]
MNSSGIKRELDLIEQLIATSDKGQGVRALAVALAARRHPMPRRTLQRRLDVLLEAGRITSEGAGRAVAYKQGSAFGNVASPSQALAGASTAGEAYVPVSATGLEVRAAVNKPLHERRPVGYNRAFLERYRPNQDAYLSQVQRERLHEWGRTSADARPAGTYARDIMSRLLIDLSWASSRLEGNTYTRLDTVRLIEQGQIAEGKEAQETQMILNHKAAIEMIVESADEVGFNRFTVLNLHAILSDNLMSDPFASGRLREREVEISGTVFFPLAVPQQIAECFQALLNKAAQIDDPFEQAFFSMVHLPYLQPFEDVNKRVSRLTANIPLIRQNLCPLSFVDVPEKAYIEGTLGVYETNRVDLLRDVFIWAYERSCQRYLAIRQSIGEPDAFRLKYRNALIQVVQEVIRGGVAGTRGEIETLAQDLVDANDLSSFVDAIQSDLDHLYLGNVARYRLRLSEFERWPFKRADAVSR